MEASPKKSKLWGKLVNAVTDNFDDLKKKESPRSVDATVAESSGNWAASVAMNVRDAFKVPVSKGKETKSANQRLNIPNLSMEEMDRFENINDEMLPFRPKSDFNYKDTVTAEYFKDNYDAQKFVEKIHARCEVMNDPEFDPKPLLSSFEAVTEELLKIKKKFRKKIEDQEDAFNATEIGRRKKLEDIRQTFTGLKTSFYSIEKQLSYVAKTAIQIGDQLETIDLQRSRASDARDLIQFFSEFKYAKTHRLDELKTSGIEGERKSAIITRRLMNLSKEIDIAGMEGAKSNVEKYCEAFETEFLSKFDQARTDKDFDNMNRYANVLFDFNGGTSCIQIYLNQNDFFTNRVMEESISEEGSESLMNPTISPANMQKLFDDIQECCASEWEIISLVFPNPVYVMQQLIQRIFAQSIQISLEKIIENARKYSNLDYLIALKNLHSNTKLLVTALHKFDEEIIVNITKKPSLTFVLDHSFEDLFIPYLEGDRYIKVEHAQMADSFRDILRSFTELHANHSKLYRRNKNGTVSIISTREALANLTVTEMMTIISQPDKQAQASSSLPIEINSIVKMLKIHFDAVNRCKELCHPSLIARHVGSLFILLANTAGSEYINLMLDMIMDELETTDIKSEPNFRFFPVVKIVQHAVTLLQVHIEHCVVPVIKHSKSVLRDVMFYKNELISSMESKLNSILIKAVFFVTKKLESLLSKQKKSDFKPKEDLPNLEISYTPTCSSIIEFINHLKALTESSFDQQNRNIFLSEIGVNFSRLILDHLQKFPTNQVGAVIITKDIQKYNESMSLMGISSLAERFDLLREIGTLFIVKPENVRTIVEDGVLSRVELRLLKPYLQMRSDWSRISKLLEDKS